MSRKKYQDLPDNAIIGFKVETAPRKSASELAVELAEALQNSIFYKEDAKAFREHAKFELEKVKTLKQVLIDLKNRELNL